VAKQGRTQPGKESDEETDSQLQSKVGHSYTKKVIITDSQLQNKVAHSHANKVMETDSRGQKKARQI
jgi:hypothetical protein